MAQERMEGATSTNVETGERLASAETQLWLEQAAGRRTVWPRRARARCVRLLRGVLRARGRYWGLKMGSMCLCLDTANVLSWPEVLEFLSLDSIA